MQDGPDPAVGAPSHEGSATSDTISSDSRPSWFRSRWRASSTLVRGLSVASIGFAIAAVVVADVAQHTHPVRHVRTVFEPARPGPVTVDSAGCPVRRRCSVITQDDPKVGGAVSRAFPGAEITSSVLVRDATSGQTYQRRVMARWGRVTVILTAQCIPGARSGPGRVERAPVIGSGARVRHIEVVDAGRGGCSVSVTADVYGDRTKPDRAMLALAHDPALQLTS